MGGHVCRFAKRDHCTRTCYVFPCVRPETGKISDLGPCKREWRARVDVEPYEVWKE